MLHNLSDFLLLQGLKWEVNSFQLCFEGLLYLISDEMGRSGTGLLSGCGTEPTLYKGSVQEG